MNRSFQHGAWGLILGGSSGFGLASAQRLAAFGMNLCLVHRDRRGAMGRIEPEFEKIRGSGVTLLTRNLDALSAEKRSQLIGELGEVMGGGHLRLLLHSIAFGNLKLLTPRLAPEPSAAAALASELGIEPARLSQAVDQLFGQGVDALAELATPASYSQTSFLEAEDFARTIESMGTSLVAWVQDLHAAGLFADDARVLGLTSEGNSVAWKGYAAVAAAKVALESVARAIAVEYAPHGIRCNVVQPGVTETPALAAIPGSEQLKAHARLRNPFSRLTTPQDVASVVHLLCLDEAAWINGALIRVDGGEHVSGSRA